VDGNRGPEVALRRAVIPALDTDDLHKALQWVELLSGEGPRIFKVGLQLFSRFGPKAVEEVKKRGGGVFLDLKFHDIPNTVSRAARAAVAMGVDMFNVHALGGKAMVASAVDSALDESQRRGLTPPLVLAVTLLTSLDDEDLAELGLKGKAASWVMRWARLAMKAGAQGLVASALEAEALRKKFGSRIVLVCPGIRGTIHGQRDDQKRTSGAKTALWKGANFVVMGRSLWEAEDPVALVREIEENEPREAPSPDHGLPKKGG